jgi:hypothetical protein
MVKRNSAVKAVAGGEVGKGYRASEVKRNMTGAVQVAHRTILGMAGGGHISLADVHNAGKAFRFINKDIRIEGHSKPWLNQRSDAVEWLEKEGYRAVGIQAMREKDGKPFSILILILIGITGEESDGLVFGLPKRLETLTRRGYFVMMDSTHNTNYLGWFLYTLMARDECGIWIPTAHILTAREDSDIVAEGLRVVKRWCGRWLLRYMLTDDSAGEQCAVQKAFRGLIDGELEPTHLLCRVHSERTLNRTLAGDKHKAAQKHLIAALKYRQTKPGCEESIELAMKAACDEKTRDYIHKEWFTTREKWANYPRTHSCLLLQVSTR